MKVFSLLTPAETMLVIQNSHAYHKELIKFTFMDLLFKKVIALQPVATKSSKDQSSSKKYNYVVEGKNLRNYKPKPHEIIFLKSFYITKNYRILFKTYLKVILEMAGSENTYKQVILSSPDLKRYTRTNFWQRHLGFFSSHSLTLDGTDLKKDMLAYLGPIDQNINQIFEQDPKKAAEILSVLEGNIFLLNNMSFDLLKKIDRTLISQQKMRTADTIHDTSDWWLYIDMFETTAILNESMDAFDQVSTEFDSEYTTISDSTSSWEGDSYDSSCSSCSGCGGCGGCGGCS